MADMFENVFNGLNFCALVIAFLNIAHHFATNSCANLHGMIYSTLQYNYEVCTMYGREFSEQLYAVYIPCCRGSQNQVNTLHQES